MWSPFVLESSSLFNRIRLRNLFSLQIFKVQAHTVHTITTTPLSLSLRWTCELLLTSQLKLTKTPSMAAGLSAITTHKPFRLIHSSYLLPKPNVTSLFLPSNLNYRRTIRLSRRKPSFTVCVFIEDPKQSSQMESSIEGEIGTINSQISPTRLEEKLARKKSERFTYLIAAMMSSFGITSMAVLAVYYRFYWQMEVLYISFIQLYPSLSFSLFFFIRIYNSKFGRVFE